MLKVFSVLIKLYSQKYEKRTEVDARYEGEVVATLIRLYGADLEYIEDVYELDEEPIPF